MLSKIIEVSVKSRLFVVLSLFGIVVGAAILLPQLNLDAFPDVTNVQVSINTEARGLAAEEVEQLITYPIEAVMYSMPDVAEVRSISKSGLSVITVVFKEGTDIYFARQLTFEQLQTAKEQIPEGIGTPEIGPNTTGLGQVFQYVLRSEDPGRFDAVALRSLNDWVVKLLLMPVDGVTDVLSFGGQVRQYQVLVDPRKMLSYGLQVSDVQEAVRANNRNAGGWFLDRGQEQLVIRGVGWVRSEANGLRDIGNIPVKENDGVVVRIKDLAVVKFGDEIRQGAVSMSARTKGGEIVQYGEVVTGIVLKRAGANTKTTIDSVKSRLSVVQTALPAGVILEPIYDQGDLVEKAVQTVSKALIEAFVLIIVILLLFLMNLRASLLVLISVPVSLGLALMAMSYWGVSANLMSLGGLTIAIGMMVDGSVVMMENIFKHLTEYGDTSKPEILGQETSGLRLRVEEAAKEVARPVFFAVLIIIVVFTPLFSLEGVEGKLFQPMAISIVFAMVASLVVALVVIPALSSYAFSKRVRHRESPVLKPIALVYRWVLSKVLVGRVVVTIVSLALFGASIATVPLLGTEFVPELEEGTLNIRVTLGPSVNLDTSLAVAAKLEQKLMEFPEVILASARVGRPELGGDPEPVSNIEILVGTLPQGQWTSAKTRPSLQKLMEEKMSVHPGLLFSFSQPIATRVDELLSGVKAQLAVKLFGPDLDILARKGQEIEQFMKTVSGTRDVAMEQITGEAQLIIQPDRDKLAKFGIPVGQVMDLVSDAIGGVSAGQVIKGNERYDIYIRLAGEYRNSAATISKLVLLAPNGGWIRVKDIASVNIVSGPPQIRRDDVQRRVVIQANVEGRDMGGLVAELEKGIPTAVELPPGYSIVFGGQFENQRRAQERLLIVVPLSLALIFLLLYFAFNSVGQAMLIMVNVPLAMIGGIFSLYLSGQFLSVPGSIGFIALFGVAVLNGVVMVNAINQNVLGGMDPHKAVYEGALSRLRPVLMTALIAALGLIPMLLSTGVGSEIQRPLATVVVGGLLSSTLLTLILLPALYEWFSRGVFRFWQRTHQVSFELAEARS